MIADIANAFKHIIHWIGWTVSLAAVAYLIYRLALYDDYAEWKNVLGNGLCLSSIGCLIGAVVLIPIQLIIEARRWQWTLRGWKEISLAESLRQTIIGGVAGFVTPYKSGDIPARLAMCGLETNGEQLKARGKEWLRDWKKWGPVAVWTLARYIVWGVQLWAVLTLCGITMTPLQAFSCIAIYYVLVSIMPSVPAADVALKGGWATVVFAPFTDYIPSIAIAVTLIWLLNTVIPVLCGVAINGWRTWTRSTSHTRRM